MPVFKFRGPEKMEESLWRQPDDPELWRAIARVWRFASETCPLHFPPGVYRHRSIEDAKRLREVWDRENFRVFWQRRGMDPVELAKKR